MRFIPAVSRVRIPLSLLKKGVPKGLLFLIARGKTEPKELRVPAVERAHEVLRTSEMRGPERSVDPNPPFVTKKEFRRKRLHKEVVSLFG